MMRRRSRSRRPAAAPKPSAARGHRPERSIALAIRHPRLRCDRRAVIAGIRALDAAAGRFRGGCPAGDLSLVILTDGALARLHRDFLDDPAPTDAITFAGNAALGVAGEICVSADAAVRQRGRRSLSRELMLYLVHGWLHLAGYDDLEPSRKRVMRRAETRALHVLDRAGIRPAFRLARK